MTGIAAFNRLSVVIPDRHALGVFEPIAALLPLQDIATLDALPTERFAA